MRSQFENRWEMIPIELAAFLHHNRVAIAVVTLDTTESI
jgi:hypothetical protein